MLESQDREAMVLVVLECGGTGILVMRYSNHRCFWGARVRGSLTAEAPMTVAVTGESDEDSRLCLVRGAGFNEQRVEDELQLSEGSGLARSDEP